MADIFSTPDPRDTSRRRTTPDSAARSGPVPGRPCPDSPEASAADVGGGQPDTSAGPANRRRPAEVPRLQQPAKGRRLASKTETPPCPLTPEQRLLLLDTWQRSGLPAGDFAPLVGLSKHTLYAWKKKFETEGPAGLMDKPRGGPEGSRLPELTKRTILMLKQANPDYGVERISALSLAGRGCPLAWPPSPRCFTRPATNWRRGRPNRTPTRSAPSIAPNSTRR